MAHSQSEKYDDEIEEILEHSNDLDTEIDALYEKIKKTSEAKANNHQSSVKSAQGEHVINKSILKLQNNIVDEFLYKGIHEKRHQIKRQIDFVFQGTSGFQKKVKDNIQDMTAKFDDKEFYYDSNCEMYRAFVTLLRKSAVKYMLSLYNDSTESHRYKLVLIKTCNTMNTKQIYVDQMALRKYEVFNSKKSYETARANVYQILDNLVEDIPKWLQNIKNIANTV